MKMCDRCGRNEATMHFFESVNGRSSEGWLCAQCADSAGFRIGAGSMFGTEQLSGGIEGLISAMFGESTFPETMFGSRLSPIDALFGQHGFALPMRRESVEANRSDVCPSCKTSFNDYASGRSGGCEDCSAIFAARLGKKPVCSGESELMNLKAQLKTALDSENYEEAARLRDRISRISKR